MDRVGQQFGNYRLTRLLGRGGFADVYLGQHIYLDTYAAIKILHGQLSNEDVEKFRDEARTLARLVHPQIVRLLDFGIDNHVPFLVMDYAPNGTFRQRYPRHTILPLTTIVPAVIQVAEALQFAHDQTKALEKDPQKRFGSVREFAQALSQTHQADSYAADHPPEESKGHVAGGTLFPKVAQSVRSQEATSQPLPLPLTVPQSYTSPVVPQRRYEPLSPTREEAPYWSGKSSTEARPVTSQNQYSSPGSYGSASQKLKKSKILYPRLMFLLSVILIALGFITSPANMPSNSTLLTPANSTLSNPSVGIETLGLILVFLTWAWVLVYATRRRQGRWIVGLLLTGWIALLFYVILNPE